MPDVETEIPSKILLVDDEENILRAISRLLDEEDSLEILTATSGEQGLEVLRNNLDVALIISDQRMPGMSGAEFLQQSCPIAPDALRMVLTGYADINATMDAINKGGAARYITKPWDDGMLVQTILGGVRQFRLIAENHRLTTLVQKQNDELQEWNINLKQKVMDHTATIRKQNEDLSEKNRVISQSFNGVIAAFSRLVELTGKRQQSHAKNVSEMSVGIAKEMGLSEKEIETIKTAALLHDIGEIGIPAAILEKSASTMNMEERCIYLQHAVRGQTALDAVEGLREVGVLIRHHHEYYDGSGIPDGFAGDSIPMGARIIACADYIDNEMAAEDGELALEYVLKKIISQQGRILDPAIVKYAGRLAKYQYSKLKHLKTEFEEEHMPNELFNGLQLSRSLFSGTGMLLLAKGTLLDSTMIKSIRRYYEIDPPATGVFVIAAREKSG